MNGNSRNGTFESKKCFVTSLFLITYTNYYNKNNY